MILQIEPFGLSQAALTYLIVFTAGALTGMAVPTDYGLERLAGFGRWMMKKLPYEPPPNRTIEEMYERMRSDEEEE